MRARQRLTRRARFAILLDLMPKQTKVAAHITGTVWKIETTIGAEVNEGDVLVILESMKMEMPIEAPCTGVVAEIAVKEATPVNEGDLVVIIHES